MYVDILKLSPNRFNCLFTMATGIPGVVVSEDEEYNKVNFDKVRSLKCQPQRKMVSYNPLVKAEFIISLSSSNWQHW